MAQLRPKKDLSCKTYVLPCGGERKHGSEHSVSLAVWDAAKGVPISLTSEYWIVSFGTGGGWGGRRLGELLGGIKGTQIQSVSQIPSRSPPLTTGNASLPSGIPKALCLTHTFSLPYGSRCTHEWADYEQMQTVSQICGPERDHKFEP